MEPFARLRDILQSPTDYHPDGSFGHIRTFLEGYNTGLGPDHSGENILTPFRTFLVDRNPRARNLGWDGLIVDLAIPDRAPQTTVRRLGPAQDAVVVSALRTLLTEFCRGRTFTSITGATTIGSRRESLRFFFAHPGMFGVDRSYAETVLFVRGFDLGDTDRRPSGAILTGFGEWLARQYHLDSAVSWWDALDELAQEDPARLESRIPPMIDRYLDDVERAQTGSL